MGHVSHWHHERNWETRFHGGDSTSGQAGDKVHWGMVLVEALLVTLIILAIMLAFPRQLY